MHEPHGIPSPYYHSCVVCVTICLTVMTSFSNTTDVSTTDCSFKTNNLTLISCNVVRISNTARFIMWVKQTIFRTFRIHGPKLIEIVALTNWDTVAIARESHQCPCGTAFTSGVTQRHGNRQENDKVLRFHHHRLTCSHRRRGKWRPVISLGCTNSGHR